MVAAVATINCICTSPNHRSIFLFKSKLLKRQTVPPIYYFQSFPHWSLQRNYLHFQLCHLLFGTADVSNPYINTTETHHPFHPACTLMHYLLPWRFDPRYLFIIYLHYLLVCSAFHLSPSHSHTCSVSSMYTCISVYTSVYIYSHCRSECHLQTS